MEAGAAAVVVVAEHPEADGEHQEVVEEEVEEAAPVVQRVAQGRSS